MSDRQPVDAPLQFNVLEQFNVPEIEIAKPARRRFRLVRAYTAALRVALSYLWFELATWFRGPAWATRKRPTLHARNGRRVRRSILKLRGLFIKAGQLASVLTNLLPEPFRAELEGLQDRVPASPPEHARARIQAEFGADVNTLFLDFTTLPVASASLAQVHRARMPVSVGGDGLAEMRDVAVKVQHADIDAIARLDLRAIKTILTAVGKWFKIQGLREQFQEIEAVILEELDFENEAENAAAIGARLGRGVSVPAVIPERSGRHVLTTEFVDGIKSGDLAALDAAGIDRDALAERILDAYGRMIFRDGLYHADPHPGNLLVRPDATAPKGFELVFLDFGAVARLTPEMRRGLAEMIAGVLASDAKKVTMALTTMGVTAEGTALDADTAVMKLIESVHERVLKDIDPFAFRLGDLTFDNALQSKLDALDEMNALGVSISDLTSAFRVPRDWILLERTVLLLIGLCTALAPDVNPLRVMERYIRPLVGEMMPSVVPTIGATIWSQIEDAGRSFLGIPASAPQAAVVVRQPDPQLERSIAAQERVAASLRQLTAAVGAVGSGAIGYAAFVGGHGVLALGLAILAGACGIGALRIRR
ncbi:MAG: AarF/ABC1/UbiB kinase family protein [Rubricoccaceae bacterium]